MLATKETFVPLYITNTCDANCSVCNMRNSNISMKRVMIDKQKVIEQLRIIYNIEKISSICILTGEYLTRESRLKNCRQVIEIMHEAFYMGYKKIFFNIGSLTDEEIYLFSSEFPNDDRIVISLFQETYDKNCYKKYFGRNENENPKANYANRYSTVERFVSAGFSNCDIGFLVGVNRNYDYEIESLVRHVKQLEKYDVNIYISLPRVCLANSYEKITNDAEYFEIIKKVKKYLPNCKIIITTRENINFINSIINYIDVISPGSSDVLPYNEKGKISNNIDTSQFVISEERERPTEVLKKIENCNFVYYEGKNECFCRSTN